MDLLAIQSIVHETSFLMYNALLIPVIFFSIFFYIIAVSKFFLKKKSSAPIRGGKWPKVTVQIPTFNEPVAIKCAESCMKFNYPSDKFEIIIGDDSNSPEVSSMLDKFGMKHKGKVKVIRRGTNKGFKAGNLNNMLRHSKGDIIVVFDSDYKPSRNFLKSIVTPFIGDKKVACVQAKWGFLNCNQNLVSRFASSIIMVYNSLIAPINSILGVPLLFGSGEAVRKDILMSMGGWQEGSLTEDVEFSVRTLKSGYKIIYLENLKVCGEVPYTLKGLKTQQKRWAYGNVRTFLQHANHIMFGNLPPLKKVMLVFTLLGYLSSLFIFFYFIAGVLFLFSTPAAPIDWMEMATRTIQFTLLTSGFLAATIVALAKEKKLGMIFSVLPSAFTVGMITTMSICSGFFQALSGREMKWNIIKKKGNDSYDFVADKNVG